jgi:hypothetical protein
MTQVYATQTTQYFDNLIAAAQAGGSPANLTGGALVVGDGNGAVPTISALIAAGGVTHEVWRGQVIQSVTVDPNAANQIDVAVDIPASSGGAEIGPFTVTEFAILDALGHCCIVGTTNFEKTVSSQGQTCDLAWNVAVVVASTSAVTITPPNGGFATMAQVIAGYNANLPGVAAPITKSDTTSAAGWTDRTIGIAAAAQPVDAVTPASSTAAMGSGRPASPAEWAAGAPTAGGFAWPWPTLQQVSAALAAIWTAINGLPQSLAGYLPLGGGTMQGMLALFADPTAAAHAATKRYVDAAISALATALGGYLPLAGGTMTGPLITARDPQSGKEAANKEYVDAAAVNPFSSTGVGAMIQLVAAGGVNVTPSSAFIGQTASWVWQVSTQPMSASCGPTSCLFSDARWTYPNMPAGVWTCISAASLQSGANPQTCLVTLKRTS